VALLFLSIKNPCPSNLLSVTERSSVLWSSGHYVYYIHVLWIFIASLSVLSLGLLPDAVSWDEGTRRCCWIWICISVCQRIRYVSHHPVFPFPRNKNLTSNPPVFSGIRLYNTRKLVPSGLLLVLSLGALGVFFSAYLQDKMWADPFTSSSSSLY
jgi:hypothetical protein